MTRKIRTISVALALSLVVIGCSGDDDAFSSLDTATDQVDGQAPTDDAGGSGASLEAPAEDMDAEGAPSAASPATASMRSGQRLIRTAELTLEVEETGAALQEVIATAQRVGGFAATSDLQRDSEGVVSGMITLRVPSSELNSVVAELEAIGDAVPVNRIDERDVTMESADLRARIGNLTAFETELQGLLSEVRETTTSPEDLLTIFERIRSVREEIDVLEGRLAALDDQVSMATVSVNLQPTEEPRVFDEAAPWTPGETFRDALAATGRALSGIADAAIWVVVTILPVALTLLLVPALVLIALIRWTRSRRARGPHAPPPPDPSTSPPAAPAG